VHCFLIDGALLLYKFGKQQPHDYWEDIQSVLIGKLGNAVSLVHLLLIFLCNDLVCRVLR